MATKTTVFFSAYTQENLILSNKICDTPTSLIGLWQNNYLASASLDFYSVLQDIGDDFSDKCFVLPNSTENDDFLFSVSETLSKSNFNIDRIIVRGDATDLWAFPHIKNSFSHDAEYILLLDRVVEPISDIEITCIEAFDLIIGLGPSCSKVKNISSVLFNKFESFPFQIIQIGDIEVPDYAPLVLCNDINYSKMVESIEGCSLINIDQCPTDELSILMNLANPIVNSIGNEEISLLSKKLGKNSISLKEFEDKKFNKSKSMDDFENRAKNLEDFSFYIKKEIEESSKKVVKESFIEGSDTF